MNGVSVPDFNSQVYSYTVSIPNTVTQVTASASLTSATSSILIDNYYTSVNGIYRERTSSLSTGTTSKVIRVAITAQDYITRNIYTITVSRELCKLNIIIYIQINIKIKIIICIFF